MVGGRRTTAPSGLCKQPRAGQIHGVQGSCSDTQRRCEVVRPGEGCTTDGGRECRSVCGTERRVCCAPSAGCGGRRQPVYLAARASLLRGQPQKRTEATRSVTFKFFWVRTCAPPLPPTPAWHALLLGELGALPPEPAHVLRVHRVPSCRGANDGSATAGIGQRSKLATQFPRFVPDSNASLFRHAAGACKIPSCSRNALQHTTLAVDDNTRGHSSYSSRHT
jgi:hypothetical protein